MSVLDHAFVQVCRKMDVTLDQFGQKVYNSGTNLVCKFREILSFEQNTNQSDISSDAMAWFKADSGIQKGDIFLIDGNYYIVQRAVKARRIDNSTILFIKTELQKFKVIS